MQVKGATKLYLMHSLYGVIISFKPDFYKPAFSAYSFEKLVFRPPVFYVFYLFYFEFNVMLLDFYVTFV